MALFTSWAMNGGQPAVDFAGRCTWRACNKHMAHSEMKPKLLWNSPESKCSVCKMLLAWSTGCSLHSKCIDQQEKCRYTELSLLRIPLPQECSDCFPVALSLHWGCPYIGCPDKENESSCNGWPQLPFALTSRACLDFCLSSLHWQRHQWQFQGCVSMVMRRQDPHSSALANLLCVWAELLPVHKIFILYVHFIEQTIAATAKAFAAMHAPAASRTLSSERLPCKQTV